MTGPQTVLVTEVESPTVDWVGAEFVVTDARPNPDETVDGYTLIHLSNDRTIRIFRSGLMDDRDSERDTHAYVNWDELLTLLDAFRQAQQN